MVSVLPRQSVTSVQEGTNSYNDNGISCSLPASTPSYIQYLTPRIVQSTGFLHLAKGSPYVYEYTDNITHDTVTIGGTYANGTIVGGYTQYLPPMVEMGFYTYGSGTFCGETGTLTVIHLIIVQVPMENGLFNISEATFGISGARE